MTGMALAIPDPPTRGDLEALPLADRIQLEDAFGHATDLIRELNDVEIGRLREAGATQRAIAEMCGKSQRWVQKRLGCIPPSDLTPRSQPIPQNGDGKAKVAKRKPKNDDGPAHHLPDVVSDDAERNLRTQALHWFEQGRVLEELLDEGVAVEPYSNDDKQAIKREADEMVRIARRLKGAI